MRRGDLLKSIGSARQSDAYRHYLAMRERVLDMLEEARTRTDQPSDYWSEELAGFEYMLDASPLVIRSLREHCYHLTGVRSFEYRSHHSLRRDPFASKLDALRSQDADDLLVSEPSQLGGFGHSIDGVQINVDTLKFYECLIALDKAGLLASFRSAGGERRAVMEIGAGWGGFAYQFKTLCPDVTYIIVDLPQTLLFSAVYLKTLFPSASAFVYGDGPLSSLTESGQSYDFVFLPHYAMDDLHLTRLDLVINIASFQEMTSEQVGGYVAKANEMRCQSIYSLNRDRSRYNDQLSTVSSILQRHYDVAEVKVLDVQYTEMALPRPKRSPLHALVSAALRPEAMVLAAKRFVARRIRGRSESESLHVYRHLVGTRKKELAAG